ncbi:MAG TPA: SDR family oxidoreductase [Phycisphaerae bacterium]|nr:SDR family oxidoreductase [Phycisphaerae bacterium]
MAADARGSQLEVRALTVAKYLVTGGAGFIGSHLVEALVERGDYVRVLDNFSTGSRENLAGAAPRIDVIEGDLRSPADCARACQGISVVFHEGAVPLRISLQEPRLSHHTNVTGTYNILEAARYAGCRRVIYAASSSAYGDAPGFPKHEGQPPRPGCPYSAQKVMGETYCRVFWECYGLETISLRYFNVFGARQVPQKLFTAVIPAFIMAILADRSPVIYGDGEQTRDFTYIDNVVQANLLSAAAARTTGQVINIGCGEWLTLNQVIAKINQALGKDIKPVYRAVRNADVRDRLADCRLAKKVLRFEAEVRFDEGLRRTIDWWASRMGFGGDRNSCRVLEEGGHAAPSHLTVQHA